MLSSDKETIRASIIFAGIRSLMGEDLTNEWMSVSEVSKIQEKVDRANLDDEMFNRALAEEAFNLYRAAIIQLVLGEEVVL